MPGMIKGPTEIRPDDRLAMAATLWGEARGQGPNGQAAVAWVIVNRWRQPGWWSRERDDGISDDTIEAVCRDKAQFSCWWDQQAPNLKAMTIVSPGLLGILPIVDAVLSGATPDPTQGADHYHTTVAPSYARGPGQWPPKWALGKTPSAIIGAHRFFALGLASDGRQTFVGC